MKRIIALLIIIPLLSACGAAYHSSAVQQDNPQNNLTVGKVQKEIKTGMTGGQVAEVLGSPNIVSTDEKGRQVWIYDKISTTNAYSKSSTYGTILVLGGSKKSGSTSTSQRTLTVVIKYNKEGKVRDFAYHSSKF